jgi:Terminase small subunit.
MATSLQTNRPLTPQQEIFCQNFVLKEEFLGNGTRAYSDAYGIDQVGNWWKTCAAGASRLLKSTKISTRINDILKVVMNDAIVDNELGYVISQKSDLNSKVAAIREYNKLKKRISDVTINDVRVLVLPNTLLKKNEIPISNVDSKPGIDSPRQTQIQSDKGRKKVRQDGVSIVGDSR